VRYLLDKCDVEVDGPVSSEKRTALLCSVAHSRVHMVEYLLERGADHKRVDEEGRDALVLAVLAESQSTVKLLVRYGAGLVNNRFLLLERLLRVYSDPAVSSVTP